MAPRFCEAYKTYFAVGGEFRWMMMRAPSIKVFLSLLFLVAPFCAAATPVEVSTALGII